MGLAASDFLRKFSPLDIMAPNFIKLFNSFILKAQKTDELKLKYDELLDKSKQLKSRHLLLIEKVKKHAESNCSNGQELTNVLAKLSSLSKIP